MVVKSETQLAGQKMVRKLAGEKMVNEMVVLTAVHLVYKWASWLADNN
jgi:hypothetical protein